MLKDGALWRLEKEAAREHWERVKFAFPGSHTVTLIGVFQGLIDGFSIDPVRKAIWQEVVDELTEEYQAKHQHVVDVLAKL